MGKAKLTAGGNDDDDDTDSLIVAPRIVIRMRITKGRVAE